MCGCVCAGVQFIYYSRNGLCVCSAKASGIMFIKYESRPRPQTTAWLPNVCVNGLTLTGTATRAFVRCANGTANPYLNARANVIRIIRANPTPTTVIAMEICVRIIKMVRKCVAFGRRTRAIWWTVVVTKAPPKCPRGNY